MGCDYYHVTYMVVSWKDNSVDRYVELDRDSCYYVEVDGEMDMTEEEYDRCSEKYGVVCDYDLIVYENGVFVNDDAKSYYEWCLYDNGIDIADVTVIKRIQRNQDRW